MSQDRKFETIKDATPREGDFATGDYFTVGETAQLMNMLENAIYAAMHEHRENKFNNREDAGGEAADELDEIHEAMKEWKR